MVLLENTPRPVALEETKRILYQMQRCVCKVLTADGVRGTCKLNFNNIIIPSLITAYNVINADKLLFDGIIRIFMEYEEKKVIQINENRTLYSNKEYDVTIIEIKPEDKIDHFLEIDEGIFRESGQNYYVILYTI